MYYTNTLSQLTFIAAVCFSFSILAFALFINTEKSIIKLKGLCFIVTLILGIFSVLTKNRSLAYPVLYLAQAFMYLSLFLIMAINPKKKHYGTVFLLVVILPAILLTLVLNSTAIQKLICTSHFGVLCLILSTVMILFILRKEKGNKSLIFWSAVLLLIQSLLKLLVQNTIIEYISLFCHVGAYSILILYFYRETFIKLLKKVHETEKKLAAVDKNLNLEVRKRVLEIERSNEVLINISRTDSLTKALNKAAILDTISVLISSSKAGSVFSVLMFDIDKFKTINDTLGHITGDKCIKKLALLAKNSLRDMDSLGRYGGDEFIAVLPGATVPQAKLVAERFRKRVEETESPNFTVSIGISCYPQDGNTVKELIAAADDGLYHSKRKGRNMVSYKNTF
ncbi:MAG: GGDEF domain-containing protein [Clostridia bacterium]|nr:GGDEF domain-containing protein [Clostridia bacterium]